MSAPSLRNSRSAFSFRDPAGRLLEVEGRLIRLVAPEFRADLESFLASRTASEAGAAGQVVKSALVRSEEREALLARIAEPELREAAQAAVLVEHERLPFPSFPYEWPPEMLHAAGRLTLCLAERLLGEGLGLKDATPYNVLFRGPEPVFVDVLSVERRAPTNPTWLAHAQFVRTFLLPLLVNKHFGLPLDKILTSCRDGLEPEEVYRMCGFWRRLHPAFLGAVTLPTLLNPVAERDAKLYQEPPGVEAERARYTLERLLRGLEKQLERAAPRPGQGSRWSSYAREDSYSDAGLRTKQEFVARVLSELRPRRVLDVGCNRGEFSVLAASQAEAQVVAVDTDPVVVGEVWRRARAERLDILPLVVNLARPTPAIGWHNRECPSFLERARNGFDAVLLLAVLHHIMVGEGIPLEEVLELAAELTTDLLVIEYVDPADKMFRRIARGRDALYRGLTRESFEAACRRRFRVTRCEQVPGADRWLYCLRKPEAAATA